MNTLMHILIYSGKVYGLDVSGRIWSSPLSQPLNWTLFWEPDPIVLGDE